MAIVKYFAPFEPKPPVPLVGNPKGGVFFYKNHIFFGG
jgi:hypothetical protein